MLRTPNAALRRQLEHDARRKHEGLIAAGILLVVAGFIVFVFVIAPNDHSQYCETEGDRARYLPYFRPIESKEYGTPARSPYIRTAPYNDNWGDTPYPKSISDILCEQSEIFEGVEDSEDRSNLFWSWGQFVTHTFAMQNSQQNRPSVFVQPGVFVGIKPSEYLLDNHDRRQQINLLAPYIDGSVIYGHTLEIAASLRDSRGKILMGISPVHDNYILPINETTNKFYSGDVRVTENVLLSSMHTLWNREHNHWARVLDEENPGWTSQHIFNMAKQIVIGEMQAITYREWLPLLLGTRNLYGREPCPRSDLKAEMGNEFSIAAFRLGHTMVTETLEARDIITGNIDPQKSLTLLESFEQVSVNGSIWNYDIDVYLFGASLQKAEQLDNRVVNALRGTIFDLAAMNLARGRDHRLASYQQLYEQITGRKFTSYSQLTRSVELQEAFYEAYGDPETNQIDPWIGIISEDQYGRSMLGRVGSNLVAEQFALMRDADPYFYEWDKATFSYRAQIHNTRLSDIIRRNTEISWEDLGPNVFVL